MVHAMVLFYIGIMCTISACKNVEWLHKKVLVLKAWWDHRRLVRCEYIGPVV